MKKSLLFSYISIFSFLIFAHSEIFALSLTDASESLSAAFEGLVDDNEGTTSFPSLLIPNGGRAESLGGAYTGYAYDVSFMNYNPAASSLQQETQFSIFHNSWIADSKMETIAYTTRFNNLGFGTQVQCFYMPFTEYNFIGERTAGSYYSETFLNLNVSYNFLAGYDFKGIAVGGNLKTGWRGMPDYTDKNTNALIPDSGLSQSALAIMADLGVMMQFNLFKVLFRSRTPNCKVGLSIQNLGVSITGFGSGTKIDDPLPTAVCAGFSYTFFPSFTVTADFRQPINLQNITHSQKFSIAAGTAIDITKNFTLLAGFNLKGANPKISAGTEFTFQKVCFNFNYTLDLASSINPINRISLSAKINLGDRGRSQNLSKIDELYTRGLVFYYNSDWENAIATWEEILEIDSHYDPAILGIKSAKSQMELYKKVKESLFFEE
ncbi:MAG: UPF0164 family protein [Treponema sp.]|nr:UPF0164 family protein [Treponema sp.]